MFTMLAITLERRRAVIRPLGPKTTKKVVIISLVVIWTVCSVISLPPTFYSTTIRLPKKRWVCIN